MSDPQNPAWGDIYSGVQTGATVGPDGWATPTEEESTWAAPTGQVIELDDAGKALLELVPDDLKAVAEIQFRGPLAAIRTAIGFDAYLVLCSQMKVAALEARAGNMEGALEIMRECGFPVDMMLGTVE